MQMVILILVKVKCSEIVMNCDIIAVEFIKIDFKLTKTGLSLSLTCTYALSMQAYITALIVTICYMTI